ncbi:reverse transcriptase domain-containing protein [Tanacetum coccineum]
MEKARRDKRKEVQIRLNFKENPKKTRRERENSLNSRAENSPTRFHPGISRTRCREKRDDRNVFNRLSHRRKSVHERLSDTYSPSATKSGPSRTDSRDPSHSRGHSLSREHPRIKDRFWGVEESYGDTYSQGTRTKSESSTSNGGHWKSRTKRRKLVDEDDLALKKKIEELVQAGKLSHLIKEIKQGRDQTKNGKKEGPAKYKSLAIYMIQPWQRMTRQKLTQSFACGNEITFPPLANSDGTEGPLVIEAEINGHMIHHMYIDGGSSTEVLYEHCFNQLLPKIKNQMVPATTSLTGFSGETIWPLGQLRLLVTIGDADHSIKAWMNFMIVRSLSPYNGIIGRPGIREIQAVPSTAHGMLKFPANRGIVTIRRGCNRRDAIHRRTDETVHAPKENLDTFAWQPSDMTRVPRSVAEHRLNIREGYSPVRQKKRGQAPERSKAIQAENADATYQRLVDKAFDIQVVQNMEVYVDDLVIKSHTEEEMIRDINETFRTPEGIKLCPDKTKVVLQLPSPWTIKEVQSLNGKLASLNRFLSKLAEKSLPLFKTLKKCIKKSDFHWTPEAEQAFTQLKQHLSELPLLVAPKPKEELIVYLAASHGAISAVLMTERDTVQTSVYFVSRALQGPELNYSPMEKLVLSLVFTAKRLWRYFQAHPIVVITDQPIKQIMSRPDVAGRLQKWSVMLGEHSITYLPRTSVKGQILADFLVEKPDENLPETPATDIPQEPWTLFTDGSSSSNNEAEYEALIAGLRIAAQMGVRNVRVSVDSKLVANQVLGAYVAKEQNMIKYLEKVKSLVSGFASFSISQVPRSKNKKADALSKIASTSFAHLSKQVLVEILKEKSIHEEEVATVVEEEGTTWMTPIIEYLKDGTLPGDRKEASKLRIKARQYELLEGILYKRSFLKPWLRCVGPLQADYVIREIHEGSCIAMDYFTKWIEAKSVATITGNQVKKFVWDNIVCRFGLPGEIVSDNGKQFSDNPFKDWCDKLNITQRFASVKHSQSNGLVERENRSLGEGIKARLDEGNKN